MGENFVALWSFLAYSVEYPSKQETYWEETCVNYDRKILVLSFSDHLYKETF